MLGKLLVHSKCSVRPSAGIPVETLGGLHWAPFTLPHTLWSNRDLSPPFSVISASRAVAGRGEAHVGCATGVGLGLANQGGDSWVEVPVCTRMQAQGRPWTKNQTGRKRRLQPSSGGWPQDTGEQTLLQRGRGPREGRPERGQQQIAEKQEFCPKATEYLERYESIQFAKLEPHLPLWNQRGTFSHG